jgi:hypothetical protein
MDHEQEQQRYVSLSFVYHRILYFCYLTFIDYFERRLKLVDLR